VKREIAFFDFDGTITVKDTFLEFIKFSKGNLRFYLGFLLNSPYLVGYKIRLIPNQKAKEKVLQFFFKNTPVSVFNEQCEHFAEEVLPKLIRPKALEEIKKLKGENAIIVVVSASPENWIQNWARKMGLELLASKLEVHEGRITGNLLGKNCHGKEKVRRIMEKYSVSEFTTIYAYGDTKGDLDMMKLAHNSFYRPFRKPS